MVIGSPFSVLLPVDQLFVIMPPALEVLPNLILLPNLPSNILSPAKGKMGWIFPFSSKVPPLLPFKSILCFCVVGLFTFPVSIEV